jgi:hypothetical protein
MLSILVGVLFACLLHSAQGQAVCGDEPCLNGGTCINGSGNGTCKCPTPWTGHHCHDDNSACLPNPCENNGTCDPLSPTTFSCICAQGFYGPRCDWTQPVSNSLPGLVVALMLIAVGVCVLVVFVIWHRQQKRLGVRDPVKTAFKNMCSSRSKTDNHFNNPLSRDMKLTSVVADDD